MRKAYDGLLTAYDVLLMPTLPYVAPKLPQTELAPKGTSILMTSRVVWNKFMICSKYKKDSCVCQLSERFAITNSRLVTDACALAFGMVQNTAPFNLTGHPVLTINAGYSSDKLPIGLSIVGKHFDDVTVLAYAHTFEQERDKHSA